MGRVIVIGGGAAGFFGAIACAEEGVEDIEILEKGPAVLSKVRISGGGRCNVTHSCFDPADLVERYPRGRRSLLGPFHRWQPRETVAWFEERGVELKTEEDGRMFPVTDDSQTVIDCLTGTARDLGVRWRTRCGVEEVRHDVETGCFSIRTTSGEDLTADCLLVATGGVRSAGARRPAEQLGHGITSPVPSLFTFHIEDQRLRDLPGISVEGAIVRWEKLRTEGPVLITHWGLSGPAILKLSALGARELAEQDYRFEVTVDWSGGMTENEWESEVGRLRDAHGARRVMTRSPVPQVPRRLWERLVAFSGVGEEITWATLSRKQRLALGQALRASCFMVRGKSLNKEEFVTCGGVLLREVNLRTMESKLVPGLYFAGEVLDVDGITGGFNFQAAWTTGYLAGKAIAECLSQRD